MFLTDTAEGLKVAESVGVNSDSDDERSGRVAAAGDAQSRRRDRFPTRAAGFYSAGASPKREGRTTVEEIEESAWDEDLIQDFGPGGKGEWLVNEIRREISEGQARPLEEGFVKRRRSDS